MGGSGVVRDIALRTAAFTAVGSLVIGAVSAALFIVVPLVAFSAGYPEPLWTLYDLDLPPAFPRYNPWEINELGLAGYGFAGLWTGAIIGILDAPVGCISGAVAGLATGALAARSFFPITYGNRRQFRRSITLANIVIAAAVAYSVGSGVYRFFGSTRWFEHDTPGIWLIHAFLPGVVIALAAWWASSRVAAWYEDQYIEGSPMPG